MNVVADGRNAKSPCCDLREKIAVLAHRQRGVESAAEIADARADERRLPVEQRPVVHQRAIERPTENLQRLTVVVEQPARPVDHERVRVRTRRRDQSRNVAGLAGIVVIEEREPASGDRFQSGVRRHGSREALVARNHPKRVSRSPRQRRKLGVAPTGGIDDDCLDGRVVLTRDRRQRMPKLGPPHAAHDDRHQRDVGIAGGISVLRARQSRSIGSGTPYWEHRTPAGHEQ